MRLLIALVIWAGAIAGAAGVSNVVADSIHHSAASSGGSGGSSGSGGSGSGSGGGGSGTGGSVTTVGDPSSVKASDSVSMFHTANLGRALATVRSRLGTGAKIDMAVVYPGYLDMTLVKGGSDSDVYVDVNGRYIFDNTGGDPGAEPIFSLSKVQASIPATLAQRISAGAHMPLSELHYVVLNGDPISKQLQWLIYPVSGTKIEYFRTTGPHARLFVYRKGSQTGPTPISK